MLGDGALSGATLTVANGFTNNGLIELTSVLNAQGAGLTISAGVLVNAATTGVFNVLPGTGGTRTFTGQLDNQGTVTIDQLLTFNGGPGTQTNSGTVTLAGGDLTLGQSGSFTNAGTIDIGTGRTWTVNGGTLAYTGGAIGGAGTLNLSGVSFNLTPNFTNTTTGLALTGSTVNGPGILTNAAGKTLTLTNSTVAAPFTNDGLLVTRGGSTAVSGALTAAVG